MNYFTTGDEYETKEMLMDEGMFRRIQEVMAKGGTHIVLDDRIIKTNMVKEILPADDIIAELTSGGMSVKQLAIKTAPMPEKLKSGGWKEKLHA